MPVQSSEQRQAPPSATFWVFACSAAIIAVDQVTKVLVRKMIPYADEHPVIDNILVITHIRNRGAAFGLFSSSTLFLILISIGVCAAILAGRSWWTHRGIALRIAIALELGGAVGNLIDRLSFGHVTDFILFMPELPFIGRWPAFNIADSALTCGALLMALSFLLDRQPSEHSDPGDQASPARGEA